MILPRFVIWALLLALPLLPACEQKSENPATGYVDALKSGYVRSQETARKAGLVSVRQAVQAYHAVNGVYPAALKDIEGLAGSQIDPSQYDYDPATGTVALKASE